MTQECEHCTPKHELGRPCPLKRSESALDCRTNNGWLGDAMKCQQDADPSCAYHRYARLEVMWKRARQNATNATHAFLIEQHRAVNAEKELRALRTYLNLEPDERLPVALGVGDGAGNLYVYGSYEATKVCQEKLLLLVAFKEAALEEPS